MKDWIKKGISFFMALAISIGCLSGVEKPKEVYAAKTSTVSETEKMNMTILLDEFLDFGALKAIGDLKNKNTYNFQKDADRKAILPYLKSVAGETAKYQYNKKYNKSITRKFSKLIFGKESSNSKILNGDWGIEQPSFEDVKITKCGEKKYKVTAKLKFILSDENEYGDPFEKVTTKSKVTLVAKKNKNAEYGFYALKVKFEKAVLSANEIYMEYLRNVDHENTAMPEYRVVDYKIIDFNHDGKKELIYDFFDEGESGGPVGSYVCAIKKGKVKELYSVRNGVFFTIKGQKNALGVTSSQLWADSAAVLKLKDYKVIEAPGYECSRGVDNQKGKTIFTYTKNGKKITKSDYKTGVKKMMKDWKEISMKKYTRE